MKILYLSRFLPHAEVRDSGSQDRYHYLEALSRAHDLVLLGFMPKGRKSAITQMDALCDEVVVVPFDERSLWGRLWRVGSRLALSRLYGRVVSLRYYQSLRNVLVRYHFDLIIVEGEMALYGARLHNVPRVLDEVDIYSVVAFQLYRNETNFLRRLTAYVDWIRTHLLELRLVQMYEGVFARSSKDAVFLKNYIPDLRVKVLAPWFEGLESLQRIPPVRPHGNSLLFVGAMHTPKNVDAILFFVNKVLPMISARVPDAVLHVVGADPPPVIRALDSRTDVIVTGEVDDLYHYYENCVVNVVPLRAGGGVIVKTLNGMAAARPTVSTQAGASGMAATSGKDLLVVPPEPKTMADAIVRLLQDSKLWEDIAVSGRSFVRNHYDWPQIIRELDEFLHEIAQGSPNRH